MDVVLGEQREIVDEGVGSVANGRNVDADDEGLARERVRGAAPPAE
ncbi:MAG: hypothetical protein KGN02_07415 [bacterium]|nr:hypothetical protein [bacterium]